MNKKQLKDAAVAVAKPPAHFQLAIENYREEMVGQEGEVLYSWTDEKQEEEISVQLDLNGNLVELTIERTVNDEPESFFDIQVLKEKAEQFVDSHYKEARQKLVCSKPLKVAAGYRFYFEQLVISLPLAHAGFLVDMKLNGEVAHFRNYGLKPEPSVPQKLISKEKLKQNVKAQLDFQLVVANVNPALEAVEKEQLRLVYEIAPYFMKYRADQMEPVLTIVHDNDEEEAETAIPLEFSQKTSPLVRSIEEVIGITEEMEIVREVEFDDKTGIVWRSHGYDARQDDLSLESFFKNHNQDTVKAFISKKTKKINGFIWFKERSGTLELNREQCYEKAGEFLQMMIPDVHRYLRLVQSQEVEVQEEQPRKESFVFRVYSEQGIPVFLETVMVTVNRYTGLIDYYDGPNFDFDQLKELSSEALISKKEAQEFFLKQLDFELEWDEVYEEEEKDILVYRACDRLSRTSIKYIDAATGNVIVEKSWN